MCDRRVLVLNFSMSLYVVVFFILHTISTIINHVTFLGSHGRLQPVSNNFTLIERFCT